MPEPYSTVGTLLGNVGTFLANGYALRRGDPLYTETQIKKAVLDALEEAEKVCKQMETAIDGGGNTYYRPADARQCVEAIRKLKGTL